MIEARQLSKSYGPIRAMADVSLAVRAGEALGIVGESGCGKTTTARTMLRLEEPSTGTLLFNGADVTHLRGEPLRRFRAQAQLVFQNPFDALNPRFTIRRSLSEPLQNFAVPKAERADRIERVMARVLLLPSAQWLGPGGRTNSPAGSCSGWCSPAR